MTVYIVDCDDCGFREQSQSYNRAKDAYDSHHTVTGHRPPMIEERGTRGQFTVDCDRCSFRERTDSYDRAKALCDNHHIPTGHNPVITEK